MNSTSAKRAWIHPSNNWATKISCSNNPWCSLRSNLHLPSKQKSSWRRLKLKTTIATKINLRLKSQGALTPLKRSKESKKTKRDSQIKSISYWPAISNWKQATKAFSIVKRQSETILRNKRLMAHASSNCKVRWRTYRKQMQTWWTETWLCRNRLNSSILT